VEAVTDIFWVFWNQGIMRPMVNLLLILYTYLFQNFGLAIIAFTVIVHFLTLPLAFKTCASATAKTASACRRKPCGFTRNSGSALWGAWVP
jgi:membrane protein insertase Oxa1/YidC/SpoIIIJ